jgi:hypothetical protein
MRDVTRKDWKLLVLGGIVALMVDTLARWMYSKIGQIDRMSVSAPLQDINVEFWIAQITVPLILLFFYFRRFEFSIDNNEVIMKLLLCGMGVGFLMVFGFNLPRIDEWLDFIRGDALALPLYFFIPCAYLMQHLVQLILTGEGSFQRRKPTT